MLGIPAQTDLLVRLLDASQLRHETVSQNLANVNTPNYQRREVQFEGELVKRLMAGGVESGLRAPEPTVEIRTDLPTRPGGSNVDVDREIGELQKNSLLYQTYSQVLASQFSMMRRAIGG